MKKEELLRNAISSAISNLISSKTNIDKIHTDLKVLPDAPIPKYVKSASALKDYSLNLWHICENAKQEAAILRLFSPVLNQIDQAIKIDDTMNNITKSYEQWRQGLDKKCINVKAINKIKFSVYELSIYAEMIIAKSTTEKEDFKKFVEMRNKDIEEYKDSFQSY